MLVRRPQFSIDLHSVIASLAAACALAVLCAAPKAVAQGACDVEWPEIPDDSESGCPEPGETLIVAQNEYLELRDDCDYRGVDIEIVGSNSWLNCNHAVLRHGNGTAAKRAIFIQGGTTGVRNIRVSNCFIEGYENGLRTSSAGHPSVDLRQVYWNYEHDLRERYNVMTGLDSEVRASAVTDVVVENVHVRATTGVAFYVAGSQRIELDFVSVSDNSGPGVYLDAGARDNHIVDSCFKDTGREGIAVDASAGNLIERNHFISNAEGGIFLYKNAGERNHRIGQETPPTHGPRTQHAMANVIQDNVFQGERRGVWIASRAPRNYAGSSLFWSDPVVYAQNGFEYRRDFAEGNVVRRNNFLGSTIDAVVVEDDNSIIVDNYFEITAAGSSAIYLGSRPRQWIDEPVYGTEIRANRFYFHGGNDMIVHSFCTLASNITGNFYRHVNGAYQPYTTFPAAPCASRGRLHPTLLVALY